MRTYIIILLILVLAIPASLSAIDVDVNLENNETITKSCESTEGERLYNITNDNGQLIVEEVVEPDEPEYQWSNWSSWWVMYNAEKPSNTFYWVSEYFGGSVEVEPSQSTCTFDLIPRWNIITAPKDVSVYDIIVVYRGTEFTWSEASSFRIVYKYAFTMSNQRVSYLYEGTQYKFYAYRECSIVL